MLWLDQKQVFAVVNNRLKSSSLLFEMQHDQVLKKMTLNKLTQSPGLRGSAGKIFTTMLLHPWFPLIWCVTWPCSGKVELSPFDLQTQDQVVGVCRQNSLTMLVHSWFPFILICNMIFYWKSWILTFWPLGLGGGVWGSAGKNISYHFTAFRHSFWICKMTMFWK